jgi:Protein of unknown function (DUF2917)
MFELPHGHAMSLKPEQHGALCVKSGRLYVTTNRAVDDYFLETGDTLFVQAGAHIVAEAWNQNKAGMAMFEWIEKV